MAYEMTDRYLDILVKELKKNTSTNAYYFDYKFVSKFILPDFGGLNVKLPKRPNATQVKKWADKLLGLSDLSKQNCDDCITILLDSLLMRGYIVEHRYVCKSVQSTDAMHFYPDYIDKTFDDIFKGNPAYITKYSSLAPSFLSSKIQDVQYINKYLFYLSVGNWNIEISPYAALVKYDLGNGIVYYIKKDDNKFYRRDTKTGKERCLSDSKILVKRFLLTLDDMVARNSNNFSPEDGERVFGYSFDDHYSKNKNKKDSQFELMKRSLRHSLEDDFDKDFVTDNYILRARNSNKPITKIKYCGVL